MLSISEQEVRVSKEFRMHLRLAVKEKGADRQRKSKTFEKRTRCPRRSDTRDQAAISTGEEDAGTSEKATGTNGKAAGTSKKAASTSEKAAGTSRREAGTSRKAVGTRRTAAATSKRAASLSRKETNTSSDVQRQKSRPGDRAKPPCHSHQSGNSPNVLVCEKHLNTITITGIITITITGTD